MPEDQEPSKDLLERTGCLFGEFNVPWANHVVCEVDPEESPADLVGRICQGECPRVAYPDLTERAKSAVWPQVPCRH